MLDLMTAPIFLHHYPASPFSEKIRLMLGYLGVPWQSVEISSVMPRPLLMPLTGGYRRTPTLQIGANVYCDTAVITEGLVRHTGDETLLRRGFVVRRTAEWADTTLFRTAVALNFRPEAAAAFMSQLSPEEVQTFMADRAELTGDAPMVTISAEAAMSSFESYLGQLDDSLRGAFLFGEAPSAADFSVYHGLWFVNQNPVNAPLLEPFGEVQAWMERMTTFGHGDVTEATGESALTAAADSEPAAPELASAVFADLAGKEVQVTPTDYGRIPVTGRLITASPEEIVIERQDNQAGCIMTHFPNIGFELSATD
jgi:glutathione S-transferase